MKNTKKNIILVLIVTFLVLFFVLKDDYQNILNNLINANKVYILFGIVFIFLYWLLRAVCLFIITREYSKKVTFKNMFKQIIITQFFNGITPFSTGGQPMQVYMLNKSGIKIGSATSIIVQDFIMYQLALVVMGMIALIANWKFNFFTVSITLRNLIILGFLINIFIGLFMVFVSFSTKFNDFIGKIVIRFGTKFKLVKDREIVTRKWEEKLAEFHESALLFKKKKSLFVLCFLYNLFSLAIFYVIPLFVFLSLDSSIKVSILSIITSSAFVLIIGNFVPIPGGSGGIEYGFLKFFGSIVASFLISSSLIIWRFITYYLGVIVGMIVFWFFLKEMKE